VQPPDPKQDSFQVLGVARSYALDIADLEQRYKDMTKTLHPDRFARADARARRASLERSVQLNQAWRALVDPVRRAEYLLSLHGIDVGERTVLNGPEQSDTQATLPVPQELLMEILELREALAEARAAKKTQEIDALAARVRIRLAMAMAEVADGFALEPPALAAVAARLVSVRYYRRFLEEAGGPGEDAPAIPGGNLSYAG
jgi:molecular chaperone HscB